MCEFMKKKCVRQCVKHKRKNASEEKCESVDIFVFKHKDTVTQSFIRFSIFICFQFELSRLDTYFLLGFPPGAVSFRISDLKHSESVGSEQIPDDIYIVTLVTTKCQSQSCSA